MRRSSPFFRTFLLVLASLFIAIAAQAQYRGQIQGIVTDPQGAVLPGATVSLTDKETSRTQVATTNDNGIYTFSSLPPSRYTLTVEARGFKKKVLDDLGIRAEQSNAVDVSLDVGQTTETVNVSADATPLIDTETANLSGTVNAKQIQTLPSFGRDVFQLAQLAPGVFGDAARNPNGDSAAQPGNAGPGGSGGGSGVFSTENRPQISANGGRQNANNVTLDGIGITSVSWGGAAVVTPNEDSVKELKVVSNGYDAEAGRFGGAQIQVISKNGTNNFHGSLFFKADRPGLNAFQHWQGPENQPQTPQRNENRFNDWGGSVGGPIWKNKVFFFFSYETIRNKATVKDQQWFETPDLLQLAPSGSIAAKYAAYPGESPAISGVVDQTCTSIGLVQGTNCNEIPGKGLDIGRPLDPALFPLGTMDPSFSNNIKPGLGGDGTGSAANLDGIADIMNATTIGPNNQTNQQFNGRLDITPTSKDLVAFSIYKVPASSLSYSGFRAANLFHHDAMNEAETVLWDHTFSSSLINEVRVNAAGWRWNELQSNPQIPLGLPQTAFIGDSTQGDHFIGNVCPGCNGPGGPAGSIFNQWTYNLKDVVTKVHGSHSLKFGGEVTKLHFVQDAPWSARPNYGFSNYWDFLNDAPIQEVGTFNPLDGSPTDVRKDSRSTLLGFFIQDDWKFRPNLTLNLGLRYEYFGPITFLHNQLSSVVLGSGANALTGMRMRIGGNLYQADKGNFGPQIGFAWSPKSMLGEDLSNKLVIRGGFGIAYTNEEQAITLNGWPNIPFTVGSTTLLGSNIVYAVPDDPHQFLPYPPNPHTILTFDSNNIPIPGQGLAPVSVTGFPGRYPTTYTYRYSLQGEYDLGHNWVANLGYQGSTSHHLTQQKNLNLIYGAQGLALNPMINNLDYYDQDGNANFNAVLMGVKHRFSQSFEIDTQYRYAKSHDNASGPYDISNYQWIPSANWGYSAYDVRNMFKAWGVYSPTIFRGSHGWVEKIAGGWSISGILNAHSGYPWSPLIGGPCDVVYQNGSCTNGGTSQLLPASYLGGAKNDYGNSAFLRAGGNFPNGGLSYFTVPASSPCTATFPATCTDLPQAPGVRRNSFRGPNYFDIDATLSKAFGLPRMPVLGEGARIEFRLDAFNLFNKLNLDPSRVHNNFANFDSNAGAYVSDPLFGEVTGALAGRTIEMQVRFSF